jgi:hypothetical protein
MSPEPLFQIHLVLGHVALMPNERFVYAWKGGHGGNAGYGSRLDTVVT